MSREIKFRAWDKEYNCYDDFGSIKINKNGVVFDKDYDWQEEVWYDKPDKENKFVLEQYTGLKDKNDKEIYEGDIIEETISIDNNITVRYKVYWDEDTLCWGICGCHSYDFNLHDELWETNLSREIIGNIHENPELLGDKNDEDDDEDDMPTNAEINDLTDIGYGG